MPRGVTPRGGRGAVRKTKAQKKAKNLFFLNTVTHQNLEPENHKNRKKCFAKGGKNIKNKIFLNVLNQKIPQFGQIILMKLGI